MLLPFYLGFGSAAGGAGLLLILLIAMVPTIFWVVQLIDAARRRFYDPTMKIVWLLVIFFTHFIGALVYYFAGKSQGTLT